MRGVVDPDTGLDVSENQTRILRQLDDRDPTMVGELAEFMGVTPSTMSLNLKRLEDAGYIRRSRDPDDRRVMNVVLTEAGQRIRDRTALLDPARVAALLGSLRSQDRRQALEGLALLAEAADRLSAGRGAYLEALTEDVPLDP